MPEYEVIRTPMHGGIPLNVGRGQRFVTNKFIDSPDVRLVSETPYWDFDVTGVFSNGFTSTITYSIPDGTRTMTVMNNSSSATITLHNGASSVGPILPPGKQLTVSHQMYKKIQQLRIVSDDTVGDNEVIVICYSK